MDRETVLMALMNRPCALSATAGLDSSSARMATVLAHGPCAMLARIVPMGLMKNMPFVITTGVSPMSGSVPTSVASRKPGSVTQ